MESEWVGRESGKPNYLRVSDREEWKGGGGGRYVYVKTFIPFVTLR